MRISDWSSDVCSSDLHHWLQQRFTALGNVLLVGFLFVSFMRLPMTDHGAVLRWASNPMVALALILMVANVFWHLRLGLQVMIEDYVHGEATKLRSEEHTSELQSLMRISYAVFCLKKKHKRHINT